ncbi:hypothetical protein BOTBODRAFT_61936 [Botryobasidium botryosum FD-172 SS1]|uniref:Uncharacterized protein n=1 Tax=Botryobasidium botryosum (strain FD-172 SS1) TaxID=930990 RepID=A0A067N1Q4_BOTB1|nr:hypothetical protein BOTBODRAFT_61936 [Botryobasidium botryosum FD-172 SS1]
MATDPWMSFAVLAAGIQMIQTDSGPVYLAHDQTGQSSPTLVVGPIEIFNFIEKRDGSARIHVALHLPKKSVKAGQATGNLKDGISLKLNYPDNLWGEVRLKREGNKAVESWSFWTPGSKYEGEIPVLTL